MCSDRCRLYRVSTYIFRYDEDSLITVYSQPEFRVGVVMKT